MNRSPIVLWRPSGELGTAVAVALARTKPLAVLPGDEAVAAAAAAAGALVGPPSMRDPVPLLAAAVERWGAPEATVILPAAQVCAPYQEISPAVWSALAAELAGAALLLRAVLPLTLAASAPRVVLLLPPDVPPARFQRAGAVAGSVLRAGLEALHRGLAAEAGEHVLWLLAHLRAEAGPQGAVDTALRLTSAAASELADVRLG